MLRREERTMKRWICLVFVLILAMALAVPAFALPSYVVSEPKWVTIDGKITEAEWGKPIYKGVTLQQAEEGKIDEMVTCWWFDGTNNLDTSFDLYLTHNDENIYVGCVVHNVDAETATDLSAWKQMNFTFTMSDYHDGSHVRRTTYQGEKYEVYTGYRIYLTADGKMKAQTLTQGTTAKSLYTGSDYMAVYSPKDRTMTYEVAVPFGYTKIDTKENEYIAFSAVIALENYNNTVSGKSDGSNRFLIGTGAAMYGGAGNWAHKGQCIRIKLVDPETVTEAKNNQEKVQEPISPTYGVYNEGSLSELPEYKVITADATISMPVIIILVSVAVVILCAVVVTLVLVRERNKKVAAAGKDGEQE